jgi:hypothetical protein
VNIILSGTLILPLFSYGELNIDAESVIHKKIKNLEIR